MKPIGALEFLSLVWPSTLLRNENLELRAIKRSDKSMSRRFVKTIDAFIKQAKLYGEGWDIYFGVATRADENNGKKSNCFRVSCVWVDFDNIKKLPSFGELQPDIIVNSGGGYHIYWKLNNPVIVRDERYKEIEAINRGLTKKLSEKLQPADKTKKFGGDMMTVDITRILRVPDFYNYKYSPAKKVTANAL